MDTLAIKEPNEALPRVSPDDLPPSLRDAMARAGWKTPTEVQSRAIPYLLARRDIMVQSRTGSGKTGCYLLPMLETLSPEKKHVQLLVLVPTRELAVQVEHEAETIFAGTGLTSCAIYGGCGFRKQVQTLARNVQIVIGTPGRILDHIMHRTLDLSRLDELVLDEADRMLSIGFYPDMKEIQKAIPEKRHTSLFSATYPPHVLQLAEEFMSRPDLLSLSQKEVHVAEVQHCYCAVKHMDKDRALIRLLESENPTSAIIFCNTRANVQYVADVLQGFGYNAAGLSSDLSQSRREQILQLIREERIQYLVATDLASRGIDLPWLSHVFLYEPPEDRECYIHRAGRTGRAGAAGTVISLVDIMEEMELLRIARSYRIAMRKIEVPDDETVSRILNERLTARFESSYRQLNSLELERIRRFVPLARELSEEENGFELLAMLLDRFYQETLSHPLQEILAMKPQPKKASHGKPKQKRSGRKKSAPKEASKDAPKEAPKDAPQQG